MRILLALLAILPFTCFGQLPMDSLINHVKNECIVSNNLISKGYEEVSAFPIPLYTECFEDIAVIGISNKYMRFRFEIYFINRFTGKIVQNVTVDSFNKYISGAKCKLKKLDVCYLYYIMNIESNAYNITGPHLYKRRYQKGLYINKAWASMPYRLGYRYGDLLSIRKKGKFMQTRNTLSMAHAIISREHWRVVMYNFKMKKKRIVSVDKMLDFDIR